MSGEHSFERMYALLRKTELSGSAGDRTVEWAGRSRALGFAKHPLGGVEIFLRGEPLHVNSLLLRRHIKHNIWVTSDGQSVTANRLTFPPEPHFEPVAAFIAEELFRNGLEFSLKRAYEVSEPIIEMALRRTALSEDLVLGLIGELRFLNVLLGVVSSMSERERVLEYWRGFVQESRDFVTRRGSVEIKSTRAQRSHHHIGSLRQVDPQRDDDGAPIEQLYLLSMGFRSSDNDHHDPIVLPAVVDEILLKLGRSLDPALRVGVQTEFLRRLKAYGGDAVTGYDHDQMAEWPAYGIRLTHTFMRAYDLNDPAIPILRRNDILRASAVQPESVQFEIELPNQVTGDLNPETDIEKLARHLVG